MSEGWLGLLRELAQLEEGASPFWSLYLQRPEGSSLRWLRLLRREGNRLRREVDFSGREDLEGFLEEARRELEGEMRKGGRGTVVFFWRKDPPFRRLLFVPVRLSTRLVCGRTPYLSPLLEVAEGRRSHLLLVLSREAAGFFLLDPFESRLLERIDSLPRPQERGGERSPWREFQGEQQAEKFMIQVGRRCEALFRTLCPEGLVLAATVENQGRLKRHLSPELQRKMVLTRGTRFPPPPQLFQEVRELLEELREQRAARSGEELYGRLWEQFQAVAGLEETLLQLQMGQLDRLLMSSSFQASGGRCRGCRTLLARGGGVCPYCRGEVRPVELRNWVEKLAERQGVPVEILSSPNFLEALGGIGGLLRF